jgi:hypothetical protein
MVRGGPREPWAWTAATTPVREDRPLNRSLSRSELGVLLRQTHLENLSAEAANDPLVGASTSGQAAYSRT